MPKFLSDEEMSKVEASFPKKKFISDEEMNRVSRSAPGYLESLGRGTLQGVTLGFSDELAGVYDKVKHGKPYEQGRDESRANNEAARKAHPWIYGGGEVGGGIGSAVLAGPGALSLKGAAAAGAAIGLGNSKADLTKGEIGGAALDTGVGTVLGVAGQKVGEKVIAPGVKYVGQKLSPVGEYLSQKFGSKAEQLAETATGATGREAEKFAPGAGRELLDRKIVRAFNSPADIAKNANKAQQVADMEMDKILSQLDDAGVKATPQDVMGELDRRIGQLSDDPSSASAARQLETIKGDIAKSMGNENQFLSTIEKWKRGFNNNRRINWQNPEVAGANKEAYRTMMDTTENLATAHDPQLAAAFKDAKNTHGLLEPVINASERRASQLSQHPILGLNDIAAGTAGAVAGDPSLGLLSVAGRRLMAPRIASTGAVALDKASQFVGSKPIQSLAKSSPVLNFGVASANNFQPEQILQKVAGTPYEKTLQDALARGQDSFSGSYFLLQQRDPKFREAVKPNAQ